MVTGCSNIDQALATKTDLKGKMARSFSTRRNTKSAGNKGLVDPMVLCDKVAKNNELNLLDMSETASTVSTPVRAADNNVHWLMENENKKVYKSVWPMEIMTAMMSKLDITRFLLNFIRMESCCELDRVGRPKLLGCAWLLFAVASGCALTSHCVVLNTVDCELLCIVALSLAAAAGLWLHTIHELTTGAEMYNKLVHVCAYIVTPGNMAAPVNRKSFLSNYCVRVLLLMTLLGMSLQSTAAAPINVDLTTFTSGAGAHFIGSAYSDLAREAVIIGDHNGDGFTDYMVNAMGLSKAIIVMKKNTTYTEVQIADLVSGQYFRVMKGVAESNTGSAIGAIGDINGDGFDDVIVGAYYGQVPGRSGAGKGAGYAHVVFGMIGPFTDLDLTADWPASSLGFMILGAADTVGFVNLGRNARGLGDVNGDGVDDFGVSANVYAGTTTKTGAGVVYVIYGKKAPQTFTTIDTLLVPDNFGSNGIYYTGGAVSDYLGQSIMPAGDFNGDDIADFLISAAYYDPFVGGASRSSAGAVYLIHGSKTALVTMDMSTFVTGAMGVRFLGAVADDRLGHAVAGVGDINDDGLDDIALGAVQFTYLTRFRPGAVYVIFGTTVAFTADVDLLNFAASSIGFAIYGHDRMMLLSVAAPAGDIDGDGVNDILVSGHQSNQGVHIVYGQKGVRTQHVDTLTDGVTSFSVTGGKWFGAALDGGKDLNGDGIPDILIGDPFATVTPEGGGSLIAGAGAFWMIPGPFIPPANPNPTVAPSEVPSRTPNAQPSADPSVSPSQAPSMTPSADPSAQPSLDPSVSPSQMPSMTPSVDPRAQPSADPSMSPSQMPSMTPSAAPSAQPSVDPSVSPSQMPSVNPSADPIAQPSVVPSVTPTARPTVPAVKNFELVVDVKQDVNGIDKDDYDAQQAAYNKTIQHTVADATDGVTPDRVTDIIVEEEEEEGRRLSAASGSVCLKYRITVFDPVLTVEKLRTQLVQAAQEGRMDRDLHYYAAQFGATGLNNGTFGEPQVTSAAVQRDASEQLTGVQIALVVSGVIVCVGLVAFCVWLALSQKQTQPSPAPADQGNKLDVVF